MQTDRLSALARTQGGVFTRQQALTLDFDYGVITQRLDTMQWRRVIGCVLTAATTVLDENSLSWAAYLACGRGAVLSGPSALHRHGLDVGSPAAPGHWVTLPPERHLSLRGVRTIRETLPRQDVVIVDGMRMTTVNRSVVDTLRVATVRAAQPLLDRALLRQWVTLEELVVRMHTFAGRRGIGRLRTHVARVTDGARSEAERRLHHLLEQAGLNGWTADFTVLDQQGVLVAVIDLAFEAAKVAVEIDGLAFHTSPEQFQRDRTRQNALTNLGWTTLRFTWDDLTLRPHHVLDTIREALARQDPRDR